MISSRPFPYADPSWEECLGAVIDQEHNAVDVATLKSKKYFGLYFSAHWCPPCRQFTPILSAFYKYAKVDELEIIFLSSDRDQAAFDEYYAEMPWVALPHEQR